eukprot:scaffold2923_cov112-Isochrysis_galbana.AAC.4
MTVRWGDVWSWRGGSLRSVAPLLEEFCFSGGLATEEVAQRAEQPSPARECVERVVPLLPLRVDQQHRPRSRRARYLEHPAHLLRRRLHEADGVVLWLGALRHP